MDPTLNHSTTLLIVSDLRLSVGRHPSTKRLSPGEDLFVDEENAHFRAHYRAQTSRPNSFSFLEGKRQDVDGEAPNLAGEIARLAPRGGKHRNFQCREVFSAQLHLTQAEPLPAQPLPLPAC